MPLILVENGPQKGQRISLGVPGPYYVGRDPSAEIQLPDPMVSRKHSAIEFRDGAYVLRDLGSANGTILNGERVKEQVLKLGDRILAGETLLTFLSEEKSDPILGKSIKGHEVIQRIGRGGMGTVYLARQISLERLVALKVLSPETVEDDAATGRFLEEARSAARLNHPNIVMVYDIDDAVVEGQRLVYYSMEYMAGGSVEDALHRAGKLDPDRALAIAADTAQGLVYAERMGLVHRDIKPGNLMVHESGAVKIGDLGIARATGAGGMASQRGAVSGSPHFISPEQARGQDLDSRADIYSLGASLFQMLAGRPPFVASDVRELLRKQLNEPPPPLAEARPDVPPAIAELVARMLAKERDRRPANARQLLAALEEIRAALRAPAAPAPPRRLRRAAILGAAMLAVLLALAAGGAFAVQRYRAYRAERQVEEDERRGELATAQAALDAERLDEAAARLDSILADPKLKTEFPSIERAAVALQRKLMMAEGAAALKRRRAEADDALGALLGSLPALEEVNSMKDLEALVPPLMAFQDKYAGTPAAQTAAGEVIRVKAALRALAMKIDRSESALRSLLITAETFLNSSPPRYREALARLREPAPDIAGTPAEVKLDRRIEEVRKQMKDEAERWAKDAEAAASAGRAEDGLRILDRLRDRVEGDALAVLESARRRIDAMSSPAKRP